MSYSDWIGFVGVTVLLFAFLLNLLGKLPATSPTYSLMNLLGAGTACLASVMINYIPFVILEGAWTLISLISMINNIRRINRQ